MKRILVGLATGCLVVVTAPGAAAVVDEDGYTGRSEIWEFAVARGYGSGDMYILAPGAGSFHPEGSGGWRVETHTIHDTGAWIVEAYGNLNDPGTYGYCTQ